MRSNVSFTPSVLPMPILGCYSILHEKTTPNGLKIVVETEDRTFPAAVNMIKPEHTFLL